MRKLWKSLAVTCAVLAAPALAYAQAETDYPTKPITLVVAFSPGGSTDNLARVIVDKMSEELGQPVIVENRPGAGGYVAWRSVQDAAPDGYTVLLAENAVAIGKALRPDEPLDPREAFEAVARIGTAPMALIVNAGLGIDTFEEFLEHAKNDPEGVTFSSSGVGSVSHLTYEAIAAELGIDATHIPYRGGGEANAAVVGGHVDSMMQSIGSATQLASEGGVTLLATSAPEQLDEAPDVPTFAELGVAPEAEIRFWWGLFVPAGTPDPVKQKLEDAVESMLQDPELQERLGGIDVVPEFAPAEEMAKVLDSEITNWSAYIEERGIKPE